MFATATITKFTRFDRTDLRLVELSLPRSLTIDGQEHLIQDGMRPGSAFWVEPRGDCTKKEWQPYVRSNCSFAAERRLETVINDTSDESDTWSWWQTGGVKVADTVAIRVDV